MHTRRSRYLRHRFPSEIIGHAVWLYHRYGLSFRDGIVKLSRIGLTAPRHARFTTGLEPIILGVDQPSLR